MNILSNHVGSLAAMGQDAGVAVFLVLMLLFIVAAVFIMLAARYKRCPSNKVLVIYGKTGGGAARCVHGGAAFVWPLFQAYEYLHLEPFVVPIDLTNALSQENIRVAVPTTVTAAISNQPGIMQNAAIRLLGQSSHNIQEQAQDIILGQMRAVIATMAIEDINRDRQAFMGKVNEAVSMELEKIGLSVINVNIRDIQDESGYIQALGRKAAAEAVNQANIDVSEQERRGKIGVAERNRDTRVAVAAANADATIGETTAERDQRQRVASLEAEAVSSETEADSKKAGYRANQRVAEENARQAAESAAREADGAIRVAKENAEKMAEDARAIREEARLNAEIVVPADAERKKVVIAATADKEKVVINADGRKQQSILVAQGDAEATLARMTARGEGERAILDGKAEGYRNLTAACGGSQAAAPLLLIERLTDVAGIQAQAIKDLPIEKIIVWDGGEGGGMSGLGRRLMGALPPMHELASQVGLDLPDFLGRMAGQGGDKEEQAAKTPSPASPASPASPTPSKATE